MTTQAYRKKGLQPREESSSNMKNWKDYMKGKIAISTTAEQKQENESDFLIWTGGSCGDGNKLQVKCSLS